MMILLGAVIAGAAEPDLKTLAEALAAPQVAGAVSLAGPLEVGRAKITPRPGATVYALTAAGLPCGLWVKGPAAFTYRVEDRFSQPVAQRNLKSASRLDSTMRDGALVVTAEAEEAVVWGWNLPAGEPVEAAPATAFAFSPWARERLERSLDSNPVRDMLLAHYNGRTDSRHVLLRSGKGDLVVDVDSRPHVLTEWLMRFERFGADAGGHAGRLGMVELAAQPIGRSWWEPTPRPYAMTEVGIDVAAGDGPRARVRSRVRIESGTDDIRLLALIVPENLFDEDRRLRPVELRRVTVGGTPAASVRLRSALLVALPNELPAGGSAVVETEMEGDFAMRPGKDNYWTMAGAELFPMPADGGDLAAQFEIEVEVPAPFVPLASGTTRSRGSADGKERLTSHLDGPMMTPALIAGKYWTVDAEHDGYKVLVSTYAHPKESEARRLANNFFATKQCYENWFGVPHCCPTNSQENTRRA
ncbi:MAG: hypothetical protein ACRD2Z_17085 [Thermoanaerobaculia bacterium]